MGLGKTYSTKYLLDSNNSSGVAGQVLSTTSTGIDWVDSGSLSTGLWLKSGDDIYNSNSANVGIGTTTPGSKLELWEVAPAAPTMLTLHGYALDTVADDTMGAFIDFKRTDNNASFTPQARIGMLIRDSNGDNGIISEGCGNLVFHTSRGTDGAGAGEDVERMRITDIGNVGIGTDSPLRKLHVGGNFAVNAGTGEYYGVNITGGEGANPNILIGDWHNSSANIKWDSSGNYLRIDAQHSTSGAPIVFSGNDSAIEYMRVTSAGKLGIDVTSPQSKLELGPNGSLGANTTNQNVILNIDGGYTTTGVGSGGQYKVMGFVGTTRDVTDITAQTSGEVLKNFYLGTIGGDYFNVNRFSFWQGGDERLTIQGYGTNAGNIGISTTNPTSKLHIAKTTTWGEMSNPIINIQNNGTGGNINTAHNMGSITWLSGTVSTAEIKAIRNTPASGDNVELRFSTSASGVQGERMTINNNGVVFINNSLGVNVTSVSTGYKLDIGGGDVYVRQAVAKISLGQFGSQGDAHFGASGIGNPTVGSQDYGFYSAHNAYRTATGAWKHSRADAIGAVRLLGGGGGSSGNSGFSFDYSANNGTSDITWTNRMQLFNTGILKLPVYGAGIMQTSSDGTVSSGGDIDIDESVIINDNLVNYKFTAIDNVSVQYWLLCFNAGANDVNGTLWGDRTSGHHQAMNLDIVVSAKGASMQTGMLTTKQVLESNEKYTLVTLTYNSNNYIAIKYDGHPYPITGNGYFSGLLKSTIGSDFLLAVNGASVSNVAAFSNANTKATIQADKVGIGTANPGYKLEVNAGNGIFVGDGGVPVLSADSSTGVFKIGDTDELGDGVYATNTGTSSFDIYSAGSLKFRMDSSGDVGIGVTPPGSKLHVNQGNVSGTIIKASGIQAQIEIETSTAGDAHLYMRPNTTGNNAAIFKMTAGTNYNWRWQDDATTPVVFMKLQQSTGTLTVTGDLVAYGSPSDKRLKENIKPIESALDKVTKLQGVTFDWKESDSILDIKEDIGFIAQDVQKVVPELVRENKDGMLSMRHQGIAPILLEAIKELKAEIDLLKSKPCTCNNCNCNI